MNKKIFLIAITLFFGLFTKTFGFENQFEENTVKNLVKTIEAFNTEKAHEIWENYDFGKTPLVISFANGHIYGFNLKKNNPAWQEIKVLNSTVFYSENDAWGIKNVNMHPGFDIDGEEAFVFKMDLMQQTPQLPLFVLVHERFHHFQFANFIPTPLKEGYQDHLNENNLMLIHLENQLLKEFATSPSMDLLKDFAAVNKKRLQSMKEPSILWERDQQRMEGLADYVSMKTFNVFQVENMNGNEHLVNTLQGIIKDPNFSDQAIKRRHYGIGAALAFALDFMKVNNWKEEVEEGMGLDELILKQFNLSNEEIERRVTSVKRRFDMPYIEKTITATVGKQKQEMDQIINQYENLNGTILSVGKPSQIGASGGGTNKKMFYLADGSTLFIGNSSVNTTMDSYWKLVLKDVPYLFQGSDGNKEFKVDDNLEIILDKTKYNIKEIINNDLFEKNFSNIICKGKFGEFECAKHPGKIKINDNKVFIIFK